MKDRGSTDQSGGKCWSRCVHRGESSKCIPSTCWATWIQFGLWDLILSVVFRNTHKRQANYYPNILEEGSPIIKTRCTPKTNLKACVISARDAAALKRLWRGLLPNSFTCFQGVLSVFRWYWTCFAPCTSTFFHLLCGKSPHISKLIILTRVYSV